MEGNALHKLEGSGIKVIVILLWGMSLIIAVVLGYAWGSGGSASQPVDVLAANVTSSPTLPTPTPEILQNATTETVITQSPPTPLPSPTPNTTACAKTGYAQKWEYLTPYVVKQGDSMQNIAKEALSDESRVNEILQLNGVGLVVGATIYLPPPTISKSSGNIKQVYGKLMEKNATSWQVGFSNDPNGQRLLIPSFWFEKITNRDSFKIGDCIKVFFDDGYTVYTVAIQ